MAIEEDTLIDFDDMVLGVAAHLINNVPKADLIATVEAYGEYVDVDDFSTVRLARIIATRIAESALVEE